MRKNIGTIKLVDTENRAYILTTDQVDLRRERKSISFSGLENRHLRKKLFNDYYKDLQTNNNARESSGKTRRAPQY